MDRDQRGQALSAHGASLPLYATVQRLSGKDSAECLRFLDEVLERLRLQADIGPVIVFQGRSVCIDLSPQTEYGREVIRELSARSEFLPCPPGECDYSGSDTCRWCGKLK
jgi:hypothetical protein